MRMITSLFVLIVFVVRVASAQPIEGDIVVSGGGLFGGGATYYFSPGAASSIARLATAPGQHHDVRMAANNRSLVVAEAGTNWNRGRLVEYEPMGAVRTISPVASHFISGIELDGDNRWIASGRDGLLSIDPLANTLQTLAAPAPGAVWTGSCVVRESGSGVRYCAAGYVTTLSSQPKLVAFDRNGQITTIIGGGASPLAYLRAVEFDPLTGDLITCDLAGPSSSNYPEPSGTEVNRVSLSGRITTLLTFGDASGCRIDEDNTLWVLGRVGVVPAVVHIDLASNIVLSTETLPSVLTYLNGIERYGSRRLTCNRIGGGRGPVVEVSVRSRHPGAAHGRYQLACSAGRRPGLRFANGQHLHLDTTDGLFVLSAQNLVPSVFRDFAGSLSSDGSATAWIVLPAGVPTLGRTVFCAGLILDQRGLLIQVTNTHWFDL